MKLKSSALLVFLLAFSFAAIAQDADSYVKDAGKALSSYLLDTKGNKDKLIEAESSIEKAFSMADLSSDFKANITRAKIHTEVVADDYKAIIVEPSSVPKSENSGSLALEGIEDALSAADKKYHTKEALKVLSELAPYLSVIGNQYIGLGKYAEAHEPLSAVLRANTLLKANEEDSIFETEVDEDNHKYVTAVCANQAGANKEAEKLLMELYNKDSQESGVYSTLFSMKIEEDEAAAMKILEKGRKVDPENTELLFAEINYYIKQEKFDVLEEKLKQAIEQDPTNPSVYSALGNVYMNLSDEAMKQDDKEAQDKYFDSAMKYFNKTIELDPESFDAYYSIGSLYFNRAAEKTKQMQELGLSKEEQKLYTELETEANELFAQALPFFKKSEQYNPSDANTLIALKEIFARQDDFTLSNEFKTRLERIQAGETITESYFN